MILQVTAATIRPGVATRRQTMDRKLVARAHKQISTAHEIIRAVSSEKLDEVADELNAMSPDFIENEIRQHPLNLDTMMASEQAADAARASAVQGGYQKGIVRHNT